MGSVPGQSGKHKLVEGRSVWTDRWFVMFDLSLYKSSSFLSFLLSLLFTNFYHGEKEIKEEKMFLFLLFSM